MSPIKNLLSRADVAATEDLAVEAVRQALENGAAGDPPPNPQRVGTVPNQIYEPTPDEPTPPFGAKGARLIKRGPKENAELLITAMESRIANEVAEIEIAEVEIARLQAEVTIRKDIIKRCQCYLGPKTSPVKKNPNPKTKPKETKIDL